MITLTRRPAEKHERLENHVVDFDHLTESAAWWNVDAAICMLGGRVHDLNNKVRYHRIDVQYPLNVAKILFKNGTKTFVYNSAIGASASSIFQPMKMKGEAEKGLQAIQFSSLTILRPSTIGITSKKASSKSWLTKIMGNIPQSLFPKRWRMVGREEVAKKLIESALNPIPGVHIFESEEIGS